LPEVGTQLLTHIPMPLWHVLFSILWLLPHGSGEKSEIISLHGLKFSPSPARTTLTKWAHQIQRNGGGVTHREAQQREKYVVEMVNNGKWPVEVYTEYQIFSARLGNVDSMRLLVEYGMRPTLAMLSSEKSSFVKKFSRSILSCDMNKIKSLLDKSPGSENFQFLDGNTPLLLAVISNCSGVIQLLLSEGADSTLSGSHGLTPFLLAASLGLLEIVEILFADDPLVLFHRHSFANTSALHAASEMGHPHVISKLCELGIDANSTRTVLDGTALHTAAQVGRWESIPPLVSSPCSLPVDALMGGDTTALYLAAQHGYTQAVETLLASGANASYAMPVGTTARVTHGIVAFTGPSPSVNSEPANGATAIHVASENGHVEVVRVLLRKVSPDTLGGIGVTPLHLAAQYSRLSIANLLVQSNASVDLRSLVDGSTALASAVSFGSFEMIQTLLRAGASPLARSSSLPSSSPLLLSVSLLNLKAFQLLLRAIPHCVCPASPATLSHCHLDDLLLFQVAMGDPSIGSVAGLKLLRRLLHYFSHCNLFSLRSSGDETLVHLAAATGQVALLRLVLDHLNTSSSQGSLAQLLTERSGTGLCPLHTLLLSGGRHQFPASDSALMVALLLDAGSPVDPLVIPPVADAAPMQTDDVKAVEGATPLYLACSSGVTNGMEVLVDQLLLRGANPNIHLRWSGFTPLIAAIDRSTVAVIKSLLFGPSDSLHGFAPIPALLADPNLSDGSTAYTQSPLLFAVVKGRAEVASLLLTAGAYCGVTILLRSKTSEAPLSLLDLARRRRDYDLLQVLASHPNCSSGSKGGEL
jgi:ankyrin repeat protein